MDPIVPTNSAWWITCGNHCKHLHQKPALSLFLPTQKSDAISSDLKRRIVSIPSDSHFSSVFLEPFGFVKVIKSFHYCFILSISNSFCIFFLFRTHTVLLTKEWVFKNTTPEVCVVRGRWVSRQPYSHPLPLRPAKCAGPLSWVLLLVRVAISLYMCFCPPDGWSLFHGARAAARAPVPIPRFHPPGGAHTGAGYRTADGWSTDVVDPRCCTGSQITAKSRELIRIIIEWEK